MLAAALASILLAGAPAAAPAWQPLEPGLELGTFHAPPPAPAAAGDATITVVRVDPARFDLRLLNASAPGEGALRTARAWAARAGAVAAINAAMYQEDYRTSVGLMRTRAHVNRGTLSREKAVLAFDALVPGVPRVRLLDRACDDWSAAEKTYGTLVQSIRMVSCDRKNVWAPSDRRNSTAAIGLDGGGRVLLVIARTPWPVHDLVDALLALPLDLRRAMYVEGGPEAQLYVKSGRSEVEVVGGFSDPLAENRGAWPVPNVIAVVRRSSPLPRRGR